MRMLFNHGLTAGELYTNVPDKILDLTRSEVIRATRWEGTSHGDNIGLVFKYCMSLVFHKMLDERLRFKIPEKTAYIDFEISSGDKFISDRQDGRFSEIDFIESDFTGYFMRYYYDTKSYQKSTPIYLGGVLKKKFLNNINSGIKYYTIKDFTMYDILDDVHAEFPKFTKRQVKNILLHGFRKMYLALKMMCPITLASNRYSLNAFIGTISLNKKDQIENYIRSRNKKLRLIYWWNKTEFDNWYYIGINAKRMDEWVEANKKSRNIVKFGLVMPRKIKEEIYYKGEKIFIFKYKEKKWKGLTFYKDMNVRDAEYIGYAYKLKFYPETITWKELMKLYEEGKR